MMVVIKETIPKLEKAVAEMNELVEKLEGYKVELRDELRRIRDRRREREVSD